MRNIFIRLYWNFFQIHRKMGQFFFFFSAQQLNYQKGQFHCKKKRKINEGDFFFLLQICNRSICEIHWFFYFCRNNRPHSHLNFYKAKFPLILSYPLSLIKFQHSTLYQNQHNNTSSSIGILYERIKNNFYRSWKFSTTRGFYKYITVQQFYERELKLRSFSQINSFFFLTMENNINDHWTHKGENEMPN